MCVRDRAKVSALRGRGESPKDCMCSADCREENSLRMMLWSTSKGAAACEKYCSLFDTAADLSDFYVILLATLFGLFGSLLERLLLDVVLVLGRRVQVPHVALSRKVRVVQETVAWLSVPDYARIVVVAEGIQLKLLIRPHVLPTIDCWVLPGVVDEHGRI